MAKTKAGVIFDTIVPGDFYRCNDPGGWTDRLTGIHVPGPIVDLVADGSRMIEKINFSPDPIQLPHKKSIIDYKDKDRTIQERTEVPFDRQDALPLHDALNMALSTGLIEHVPNEEVQEFHPVAWQNRQENYIFSNERKEQKPMAELLVEYFKEQKNVKKAQQAQSDAQENILRTHEQAAQEARTLRKLPPPPPPK